MNKQLPDIKFLHDLEQLLNAEVFNGKAMTVTAMHGFFCALASSPHELPYTEWLTEVYGGTPLFASKQQESETLAAILQFHQDVVQTLHEQGKLVSLVYHQGQVKEAAALTVADVKPWCDAYVQAVELNKIDWFPKGHDDIFQLLFPIVTLAGRNDKKIRQEAEAQGHSLDGVYQQCLQLLDESISQIYQYWRQHHQCAGHHHHHHSHQGQVRYDQPKVGRNDICPCGSQKKYKKCCGAN